MKKLSKLFQYTNASKLMMTAFVSFFSVSSYCATTDITTDKTLAINEVLSLASGDVLNIGTTDSSGSLNMSYDSVVNLLVNQGTINIGTDSTEGLLSIVGSYASKPSYPSNTVVSGAGTINIAKKGTLSISGASYYAWGTGTRLENANVYGTIDYSNNVTTAAYLGIKNLNLYEGSTLKVASRLKTLGGGIWNLYTNNIQTKEELRIGGKENVFNLYCNNAMSMFSVITFDESNTSLKINMGNTQQLLARIDINNNSELTLNLSSDKDLGFLKIKGFSTREGKGTDMTAKFTFENFANDFIRIEDISNLQIVGNSIYISDKNSYINLTAYDSDGNLIEGDWSLVEDVMSGFYFLNNSGYIPEPSSIALIFGVMALGLIGYRRAR